MCEKGKRKVVHSLEEEQSCKFKADPFILKSAIVAERRRKPEK